MDSLAKQIQIDQGTPEWHLWRKPGVGASDVAALFGKNPYKTERDLWFEKAGLGEPEDEDRAWLFRKGHEVEAELRQLFSKHVQIAIHPACFEKGIFRASLDGYEKSIGVFEAKYVGKEVLRLIAEGEVPEHHRIQVQAQLFTSDSDKAYYGARAPGSKDSHVVEIGRDEKLIKQIVRKVEAFWETVQMGKVPDLSPQDTLFVTDKKHIQMFQRLAALKTQKDLIEAEYKSLDQLVKSLATHAKVRCGDILITEIEKSGAIDYLKIPEVKALAQEYLEKFRKRSSVYKSIRFGKGA